MWVYFIITVDLALQNGRFGRFLFWLANLDLTTVGYIQGEIKFECPWTNFTLLESWHHGDSKYVKFILLAVRFSKNFPLNFKILNLENLFGLAKHAKGSNWHACKVSYNLIHFRWSYHTKTDNFFQGKT